MRGFRLRALRASRAWNEANSCMMAITRLLRSTARAQAGSSMKVRRSSLNRVEVRAGIIWGASNFELR